MAVFPRATTSRTLTSEAGCPPKIEKIEGDHHEEAFPIVLMLMGLVFLGAGVYTVHRGFDAKHELVAQNITTPADASIPNVAVNDARTAE